MVSTPLKVFPLSTQSRTFQWPLQRGTLTVFLAASLPEMRASRVLLRVDQIARMFTYSFFGQNKLKLATASSGALKIKQQAGGLNVNVNENVNAILLPDES